MCYVEKMKILQLTPNYYFEKLKREISRIEEAQDSYVTGDEITDHGINAAITAWHLPEYFFKAMGKEAAKEKRNTVAAKYPDLRLMHDIATEAKHFTVSAQQYGESFIVTTSARANLTVNERLARDEFFLKNPGGVFCWRPEIPSTLILEIDGREAVPIFKGIYEFLQKELIPNSTIQPTP